VITLKILLYCIFVISYFNNRYTKQNRIITDNKMYVVNYQ